MLKPLETKIHNLMSKAITTLRKSVVNSFIIAGENRIAVNQTVEVTIERNYNADYGDKIVIRTIMPLGKLVKDILPFRNELKVSLEMSFGPLHYVNTYRGIILNDGHNSDNEMFKNNNANSLNVEMGFLNLQLIDLEIETMMTKRIRGTVRKNTLQKTINSLVSNAWSDSVNPNAKFVPACSLVKPENEKVYDHITFPLDLPTIDIPLWLQAHDYGLFRSGVGVYGQNVLDVSFNDNVLDIKSKTKSLHMFPLYECRMEDLDKEKVLHLYLNQDKHMNATERNFAIIDGEPHVVIATSDNITFSDISNKVKRANKDMYVDSDAIPNRSMEVTDGKINTKKENFMKGETSEVLLGVEEEGLHGIKSNTYNLTVNNFKERGKFLLLEWNHSLPDLVFPGMLVKLFYQDGDLSNKKVKIAYGVLHGTVTKIHNSQQMSVTNLIVFVSHKGEEDENSK